MILWKHQLKKKINLLFIKIFTCGCDNICINWNFDISSTCFCQQSCVRGCEGKIAGFADVVSNQSKATLFPWRFADVRKMKRHCFIFNNFSCIFSLNLKFIVKHRLDLSLAAQNKYLDITLTYLMVRLLSGSLGECGVPLDCYYCKVYSEPEWYYLPTPPLGQDMTQGQFLSGV